MITTRITPTLHAELGEACRIRSLRLGRTVSQNTFVVEAIRAAINSDRSYYPVKRNPSQ